MIFLKSLTLNNFLSHEKTIVSFNKNAKLLIDGKSGSGKSSLVDAIVFATYGVGRSDNKSLIMKGKKSAEVILELEDDKVIYKIVRSISSAGKHQIEVLHKNIDDKLFIPVEANGIKACQDFIEKKILHSSYLLFVNSVIFLQNNSENFVTQTASRRKDIILEIINAGDFEEYSKKTKELIKNLELKYAGFSGRIGDLSNKINTFNEIENEERIIIIEKNNEDKQKIIEQYKNEIEKCNEERIKISTKINTIDIIKKAIEELIESKEAKLSRASTIACKIKDFEEINIDELKSKIEKLKEKKDELSKIEKEQEKYYEWKDKFELLGREIPISKDFDARITEINKQLIEIMGDKNTFCPELNKICPVLGAQNKARSERLEKELYEVGEEKKKYKESLVLYEIKVKNLGEAPLSKFSEITSLKNEIMTLSIDEDTFIAYEKESANIDLLRANKNELETELNEIDKKIEEKNLELNNSSISTLESKLDEINKTIREHNNIISTNNSEIVFGKEQVALLKQKIKEYKENIKELENIKKEGFDIKDNIDALNLLKEAFGDKGIISLMIDEIIPKLEDIINEILSEISDLKIRLDTQKSGSGKDVILEGLFITIINELGEEMDFNNFSGGETVKISYAINSGLGSLSKAKFCILDETIQALDQESTNAFLEVILKLTEADKQLMVISHLEEIKDIFDEKILIEKKNGISFVSGV